MKFLLSRNAWFEKGDRIELSMFCISQLFSNNTAVAPKHIAIKDYPVYLILLIVTILEKPLLVSKKYDEKIFTDIL